MDHFVALEDLPENTTFPPDLAERVHYDTRTKRLGFTGFMSKAQFDRLYAASESWSYRRALEELFRQSTEVESSARRPGLGRRFAAMLHSVGLL